MSAQIAELFRILLLTVGALFPIVNPLGNAPIFLLLTRDFSSGLREVFSRKIALNSFVLLVVSILIGTHILAFFGISLPVVQVGGGLLVIANGWSLFVAEDHGTLAAMLAVHLPKLYLDQLFVAPAYQGRSLGRQLLAFTRQLLPDEMWLRCVRENEKAWRWYEREGFLLEREAVEPATGHMMKYYRWRR